MNRRQTVAALLESEHREIDEGFSVFRLGLERGLVAPLQFNEAETMLRRHIFIEEELLFPELGARSVSGPIVVMIQEHGEIWRQLDGVQRLLQEGNHEVTALAEDMDVLRGLLYAHDSKEELILYPEVDELLSDQERLELLHKLLEANPPEGWRCRAERLQSSGELPP